MAHRKETAMNLQQLYTNYQNTITTYDQAITQALQNKDFNTINHLEIQRNMLLNVLKDLSEITDTPPTQPPLFDTEPNCE